VDERSETEVFFMRKLAAAAFPFAAAIILSCYVLPYDWLPYCCAIAAAVSFAGLFFTGVIRRRILITLLSLSVGFVWFWAYTALLVAPTGQLHEETASVTAVVRDYPSAASRGYRVDVNIRPEAGPEVGARLYYYREETLSPGDVIEFTARFVRTDGAEDSARIDALVSRGAFLTAYLSGDIKIIGSEGRLRYFPQRLAESVAGIIDKLYAGDVAPFMKALLVGKREQLNSDAALTTALSASGISHVVAVSGMHVSFLMGFLGLVVKKRRLFAFIGIPLLLLFMSMTGFTPSVTRAGIMQAFLICAPIFRRESDGVTSLSAALLILLAANPYSCASVSLQLSFSATLGIHLFTGRIDAAATNALRQTRFFEIKAVKAALRFIITTLATTFGALVFTIPLTAVHFGSVSIVAPLTNLLTLWAVSIAFPLGIASCALGAIFLPLGSLAAFPVSAAVRYITGVSRILAAVPFSSVYTSQSPILIWLVFVYAVYIGLGLLRARVRQYLLSAALVVLALCVVLFASPLLSGGEGASITALGVGQGQSIVITSGDRTAVVDCGSSSGEYAGALAHEFLVGCGSTSIDLLILTHFHADHANGVEYLLSRIGVSALAIPDPEDSYIAEDIIELARKRGTDIIYVTETLSVSLGDVDLVIYPPLGMGDENESGLSILCHGGINALITGDMPASGERALLRFASLPKIDLLIVGHHGSRFSTSEELLSALCPDLAIISVGRNNYGHPSNETLDRLDSHHATVLRTDEMGDITIN
jgi:competence protein ComEC